MSGDVVATFKAWINPLMCVGIDAVPPGAPPPGANEIMDYVFAPEQERTPAAFISRYKELAAGGDPLQLAPVEPNILEKLVWPLRSAKGSYALGNYLSCVALCGLVGEMIAVLTWDISQVTLQNNPLDTKTEKRLFGSAFERLGQERRLEILHTTGLIDEETRRSLDDLRVTRRKYLHFFSQPHDKLAEDARRAFFSAATAVRAVLGLTFRNGRVVIQPDLERYLTNKGVLGKV